MTKRYLQFRTVAHSPRRSFKQHQRKLPASSPRPSLPLPPLSLPSEPLHASLAMAHEEPRGRVGRWEEAMTYALGVVLYSPTKRNMPAVRIPKSQLDPAGEQDRLCRRHERQRFRRRQSDQRHRNRKAKPGHALRSPWQQLFGVGCLARSLEG